MNTTLDNFNRAKANFIMTQPPAGDLVCRMNGATLDRLTDAAEAASSPINFRSVALFPGYGGKLFGVQLTTGTSLADGVFEFAVRVPGRVEWPDTMPTLPGDKPLPVDGVTALQDALVPVLMTWGPTFSSADAIQDRLDKLVDLVKMPDRAGEAGRPLPEVLPEGKKALPFRWVDDPWGGVLDVALGGQRISISREVLKDLMGASEKPGEADMTGKAA